MAGWETWFFEKQVFARHGLGCKKPCFLQNTLSVQQEKFGYRNMMKAGFIVAAVFILTACQSEVDKCVIAEMKAWQTTNELNKEYNRLNSKYNEEAERYNEEAKKNNDEISEKIIEELRSAMNEQTGKSQRKVVPESNLADSSKQKEYMSLRELRIRVVDDRAKEVVEAEFRRACMKLK